MKSVYLIGSLRNEKVPQLGNKLRDAGFDAFDHWYGAGPEADDKWQEYVNMKGQTYKEAYRDYGARCVFEFDKANLNRCDMAVLVMPAGRSGHLELGYFAASGKPCFILFDKEPERFDVMYQFATEVVFSDEELIKELKKYEENLYRGANEWVPGIQLPGVYELRGDAQGARLAGLQSGQQGPRRGRSQG